LLREDAGSGGNIELTFTSIAPGGQLVGRTLVLTSGQDIGSVGNPLDTQISETIEVRGTPFHAAYFTGRGLAIDKYLGYWTMFYNGTPVGLDALRAQYLSAFLLVGMNPTLLSEQSVFGSPFFLHDNLDLTEPIALGLVDYLLAGAAVVGADPEFPPEANDKIASGVAGSRTTVWFYTPGGWRRLLQVADEHSSDTNAPGATGQTEQK